MGDVIVIDERTKALKITRQEALDIITGLAACLADMPTGIPRVRFGDEFFLHIVPENKPAEKA